MNFNQHISKLKKLPEVNLDKQSILLGKHQLLAEINNRQDSRAGAILTWAEAFRFMWLRMLRKIVPAERVVIAGLLVITLTVSSTYMAQAAVPGDILWPLKLTYEKAEIALATDAASEGRIHIRHADNRLKELTVIAARPNTPEKSKNISQLVRRLEKDITAADQSLKLTKEEKKDSEPQVIMALAQDLSDTALQAATALNENHDLLGTDAGQGSEQGLAGSDVLATSTDAAVSTGSQNSSTVPTSTALLDSTENENATAATEAAKVVAEVQAVNIEVSYTALSAMIEVIEAPGSVVNRTEVNRLMQQKVTGLASRLPALQEKIALVDDDYLLHRNELKSLLKKTTEALGLAGDLIKLDNLSGSFKQTQDAKDMMSSMDELLDEVASGNGFNKPKPKVEPPALLKPTPVGQVKIQSVDDPNQDAAVIDPVVTE